MKKPDIISNSSCLIALDNIGMVSLLKELYGKIYITDKVAREVGIEFEEWVEIISIKDRNYLKMLTNMVDLGEASTIALSFERGESLMILDDLKARKLADRLGLNYTGLLGVILKAKKKGLINSAKEVLQALRSAGFRVSDNIEQEILKLAGETLSS